MDKWDEKAAELLPCLWSAHGGNPLSIKRGLCCECATCNCRPAVGAELRRLADKLIFEGLRPLPNAESKKSPL